MNSTTCILHVDMVKRCRRLKAARRKRYYLNDVACFSKFHSDTAWINSCRANLINSGRYALVVWLFSKIYIKQFEMKNTSLKTLLLVALTPKKVTHEKLNDNTDECDLYQTFKNSPASLCIVLCSAGSPRAKFVC